MRPVLYVGNQNYSSWSLRPWLALRWGGIDFETRVIPLGGAGYLQRRIPEVLAVSPSGTVPALHVGSDVIWDSLAISEWAAEKSPSLWPADPVARAVARSAVSEMHSGFSALRGGLPCNIRRRAEPRELSPEIARDVARVAALWEMLRDRFGAGGPYLFGREPTIADAFYLPVVTRFRTYAVPLGEKAQAYADAALRDPAFVEWERAGEQEPWSMAQWDSV